MEEKVNRLSCSAPVNDRPSRRLPARFILLQLLPAALFALAGSLPAAGAEEGEGCSLAWRCALSGEVRACASSLDGQRLYAAVDDRRVYALDPQGAVRWRTSLAVVPGREMGIAPEGMLTLTTSRRELLLLNERGGIIWERPLPEGFAGSTAAPNGTVFLAAEAQLDAVSHTGRLRWRAALPAAPSAAPVYSRRCGLLLPCSDGFLRCYAPGGTLRWEFRAAGLPGRPALAREGIYLPNEAGTVALVSAEGTLLQQYRMPEAVRLCLPVSSGEGALAAAGRQILRLSAEGETELLAELPFTPLAGTAGGQRAALLGRQGRAAVFSRRAGERLGIETLQFPPATALPVFFGPQLLAVGGKDWIVYAYRCGEGEEEGVGAREEQDGRPAAEREGRSAPASERGEAVGTVGRTGSGELLREALLGSGNREMLEELLDRAERVLESTEPQREELAYLRAAEAVMTEGVRNPKKRDGRLVNDFPELRRRAAELVGRHGDLASRGPLLELLRYEWAAGGVDAAVEALGRLGGAGGGEGIVFLLQRFREGGSMLDDSLASAAVTYVSREFRFHGILRPDAVELLRTIYLGGFGRGVRRQAAETLRGLKRDR